VLFPRASMDGTAGHKIPRTHGSRSLVGPAGGLWQINAIESAPWATESIIDAKNTALQMTNMHGSAPQTACFAKSPKKNNLVQSLLGSGSLSKPVAPIQPARHQLHGICQVSVKLSCLRIEPPASHVPYARAPHDRWALTYE
jgi:hypothetical protein